jgi:hypothetical protein
VTFEHEGDFYIANLQIYYIAIVNATEPSISIDVDFHENGNFTVLFFFGSADINNQREI